MIAGALGVQRAYHMKLKLRKKRKNERKLLYPAVFVLLLVFGFSVYKVVSIRLEYKHANDAYEAITAKAIAPSGNSGEAEDDILTVNHASLSAMNADYIGWLDIPGAGISYPVVLAADYWEYLYTTFDKVQNNAGSIFADYRCAGDWTSRNTILYGHRMNDGSMFGTLNQYFDSSYLGAHREIHIYVEGRLLVYEVFSVYQAVAADESYTVRFGSDEEYKAWLDGIASKSAVNTGVSLDGVDRVLMLSTCKGGDNDERTAVFAALKEERTI